MTDEHPSQPDERRPSSTALARTEDEALPDAYEREYMPGQGAMLYRDKMVAGKEIKLYFAGLAAFLTFASVSTGQWAGVLLLPLIALMWLIMGVMRVSVSERSVSVKLGLFGPTIPMAAIESAVATDYARSASWGVIRMSEGKAYKVLGGGTRAVKIRWRDPGGKPQVTYVFSETADTLARAIKRGRKALPAAAERKALPV